MFEKDLTLLSTADLLESAAQHRVVVNRAEARLLEHAQVYADRHHPSVCPVRPGRRSWDGRERAVVLGGDGCPEIAEFAIAEFGVMLGISPGVAAGYLGQALALRHRFPFTWARVQAGEATPWKACRIAADCVKLTVEAARYVDRRVAALIDSITPYRLDKIVKAARLHADPGLARAEAGEAARERGVFVGHSDAHGTKTIYIRTASGNAIRYDATIADIAEALKAFGDLRGLHQRRADAVGIIADPRYAEELLTQARHHRRTTTTDADSPQDSTVAAAGPATAEMGAASAAPSVVVRSVAGHGVGPTEGAESGDERLPVAAGGLTEPGPDDEADRDAPHPSTSDLSDPLDIPWSCPIEPFDPDDDGGDGGGPFDDAAQPALRARLARIKHDAHSTITAGVTGAERGQLRPGRTGIYVHLTDRTLATGSGVLRVEGLGPLLADQLAELIGHGPYTVKPVIDLNDAITVDAYEIPDRIRERVKLTNPVDVFPYATRETHRSMDLDHIRPYDPLGPPGQTSTENLAPLGRFTHRVKTHALGWTVRRLDRQTVEWVTPHGFVFNVDPTGTHRVPDSQESTVALPQAATAGLSSGQTRPPIGGRCV